MIIPCLNEEQALPALIQYLASHDRDGYIKEIIVVDGGSSDNSLAVASSCGAKSFTCQRRGRAAQMNFGAAMASGDILYFLHADTFPPANFAKQIVETARGLRVAGCYRLRFDLAHWFLKANCWFTRFNIDAVRFGDQSLFVSRHAFTKAGGFDCAMQLMEDQEVIGRIRRHAHFVVLPDWVTTSARKYLDNGIYRLQLSYLIICILYRIGCGQATLLKVYRCLIKQATDLQQDQHPGS